MGGRDLGGRENRVSLYVKVGWPCGAIRRKFATSLLFSSEVAAFAPLGLPTLTLGEARCGGLPSPSPVLSSRLSCLVLFAACGDTEVPSSPLDSGAALDAGTPADASSTTPPDANVLVATSTLASGGVVDEASAGVPASKAAPLSSGLEGTSVSPQAANRTRQDSLEDRTGLGLGRPPHRASPSVKVGKPSGAKAATSLLNNNEVANFRRIAPHGQPTLTYRETRFSRPPRSRPPNGD